MFDVTRKIREVCLSHPNLIAVSDLEDHTYEKLLADVSKISAYLNIKKFKKILIALPQSYNAYLMVVSSLFAGSTHTPINVTSPVNKIRKIVDQLQPDVIICDKSNIDLFVSNFTTEIILSVDDVLDHINSNDMALIPAAFEANDIAYVLFTSGSTGNPKGVMISRQSLDNYVNFLPQLGFGFGERVSQQPNLGFDISMTDIFGALCYGGTLFPLSSDFDKLTPGHFIANKKITIWNSTPSSISLMIRGRQINNASFSTIKKIILIGEALYEEHLIPIFEANPNILVINSYGPTEATIAVTYLSLTSSNYTNYSNNSISIGSCIPGNELHLIGGKTKNEGEIVICGKQLSYGYINEAEKTKQQFKKFSMNSEVKFGYFTGDWAEIIDGNIYFRERIDFQAKIDGHRIELEEITAAIRKLGWDLVVAFVLENKLVAAIETIDGLQINKKKIREDLKIDLDNYAIPSMFIEIHKMPRNDNDKIDRKKLIDICRKKLNLT